MNNEIVGYILIKKIEENTCLLDGLYVLEKHRNKKIAKSLLIEALKKCQELNVNYIDINVMVENKIALELYKKLGFNIEDLEGSSYSRIEEFCQNQHKKIVLGLKSWSMNNDWIGKNKEE